MTDAIADAKYAKFCQAITLAVYSKDPIEVARALFAAAELERRNLHRSKRRAPPSRPLMLPDDDEELLDLLAKPRTTKDDRKVLNLFAAWRGAVLKAEATNTARVLSLLRAVRTYVRFELAEPLAELVRHLEDEFDVVLQGPIRSDLHAQHLARVACMDMTLLPLPLRAGERIKEDEEVDTHREDDDDFIERGLGAISLPSAPEEDEEQ